MPNGQQPQTADPAPDSGGFNFGFKPVNQTPQNAPPASSGGFDFGFTPVNKGAAAGEVLPADVAARHARANAGKNINYGEAGGETGLKGAVVGAGKEEVSTLSGLANLANKILPSSLEIPTEQSTIERTLPEGPQKQAALAAAKEELATHGFAEGAGATAENVLEWMGGEEALKGLSLGGKLAKMTKVADFIEEYPRMAKLLHIGANVAKSAAIGATQGAVKGSASGGEGTVAGAEHGVAGGAIGGTFAEAAPAVTQKLGSVLQKYAPDFSNALLRASKKANFLYGKNPGQAIIDEGINVPRSVGLAGQLENLRGQLEAAGESLDGQIKQVLSKPAVAAKKQDIVPAIQNIIEGAKEHVTEQTGIDTKAYLNELNKLEENIFTKYNTDGEAIGTIKGARLSPAEISDVKKSIGKGTQWNLDPKDPQYQVKAYVNSVRKQIYGQLADQIEQTAPEVGKLNSRYANVIEAQGLLENRIAQEHGTGGYNAALRKGEWGTALGLIFTGHPYLGLPLIANRIARSAPGRVLESRAAAATGKAMQSPVVGDIFEKTVPFTGPGIRVLLSTGHRAEAHPDDLDEVKKRDPGAKVLGAENWTRVQFADGSVHEIHPEDVDQALKQNPGAKVVPEQNQ